MKCINPKCIGKIYPNNYITMDPDYSDYDNSEESESDDTYDKNQYNEEGLIYHPQ